MLVVLVASCSGGWGSRGCQNLTRIASDEEIVSALTAQLVEVLNNPSQLHEMGATVGVVHIRDLTGDLGIDWQRLRIPMRHASVWVVGKGLRYNAFDPDLVEGIKIGYGYRDHIFFPVTVVPVGLGSAGENAKWVFGDARVECAQ